MKRLINISIFLLLFSNINAQVEFEHMGTLYDLWEYPAHYIVYQSYAFVQIESYGLFNIYDISNPDHIEFVKRWEIEPQHAVEIHIYENYLYISPEYNDPGSNWLLIYNLTDPSNPELVNEMEDGPFWYERNEYALFVAPYLYQNNFMIWDFSDPVNPVKVFEQTPYLDTDGKPMRVKYEDKIYFDAWHVVLGSEIHSYWVVDVSNPASPVVLSEYEGSVLPRFATSLQSDSLYYETRDDLIYLKIINYADIFNPVEVAWYPYGHKASILGKDGNNLFLADYNYFLTMDVSDPSNPFLSSEFPLQRQRTDYGWGFNNNSFSWIDDTNRITLVNVSDPLNPVESVSELLASGGGPLNHLQTEGNFAYMAKTDPQHSIPIKILITNISDPENPFEAGSFTLPGSGIRMHMRAAGNFLYAAYEDFDYTNVLRYRLVIYDVSDPANPVLKSNTRLEQDTFDDFEYHNGYVYVANLWGYIYDVSDPENPILAYSFPENHTDKLHDMCFNENLMYDYYGGSNSLRVIDVTDPTNPVNLGSASASGVQKNIKYNNDKIYSMGVSFRIHDVSNFPNVNLLGEYVFDIPPGMSTDDYALDYEVDDNYAYIATSVDGTLIIDIIDPANPYLANQILVPGQSNNAIEINNNIIYTANDISFDIYELQLPLPPEEFSLISPEGTISTTSADLTWESTTDPNGTTPGYDVWLATTSDFSDGNLVAENIQNTIFQVNELLVGQTYYWKVRATDDNTSGTWSSNVLSFTVQSPQASLNFNVNIGGETKGGATLLDDNTIYVASTSDIVRLTADGSIEYTLNVNGQIKSSSTVTPDHTVYIASTDNNLYSFNSNGVTNPNWPVALGAQATASVAVGPQNNLYIGTGNGIYQCISRSGSILWSFNVGAAVYSSSVISESGILYVINENGRLYAFDLNNLDPGNVSYTWRLELGESVKSSPALDGNNNLYITSLSGKLIKVKDNGTSGSKEWTYNSGGNCQTSPVIDADSTVYFCGYNGKVFAVNGQSGELIWDCETYYSQTNPDAELKTTPALSETGNELFVGDTFGVVYCISTQTGKILWTKIGEGIIEGPILYSSGNILYCASGKAVSLSEPDLGKKALSKTTNAPLWPTFQGNAQRTGYNGEYDPIGIENNIPEIPTTFFVSNNYPNPFNPSTVFSIGLPQSSNLKIYVYNLLGQKVATIFNGEHKSGIHQFTFNAKSLPSGTYFMQVSVKGKMNKMQKMLLLR